MDEICQNLDCLGRIPDPWFGSPPTKTEFVGRVHGKHGNRGPVSMNPTRTGFFPFQFMYGINWSHPCLQIGEYAPRGIDDQDPLPSLPPNTCHVGSSATADVPKKIDAAVVARIDT